MREVLWQGGFSMLPPPMASKCSLAWGAEFVEVRIDPRTRTIRVPRMVGVFAGGTILNARTARSQLLGGMVWGVGNALLEKTETDARRASNANNNLAEYHVAVNADIGEVTIETIEEHDDFIGPLGAKGLGQIAITGVAPAIANAVFHAIGIRVRKRPIGIEDILPALVRRQVRGCLSNPDDALGRHVRAAQPASEGKRICTREQTSGIPVARHGHVASDPCV